MCHMSLVFSVSPPLSHCLVRALVRTAIAPSSIVGHASSGQLLSSCLSDHSAQLLHGAVVDVALRSLMLHFESESIFDPALVHLYSLRAVRRGMKTRGTMLCWHFSLDLP